MANPLLVARQLRAGAAASNIGALSGALSGSLPTPQIASGGINASAQFAAGVVNTAAMLANAVTTLTVVYGSTSSPSVATGGQVNCPDMSITLTTGGPSAVAADLLCIFMCTLQNTVAGALNSLSFNLDSVGGDIGYATTQVPAANGLTTATIFWRYAAVAAGSHNVAGRWGTNAGTLSSYGTQRALAVLELRR